MNHLQHDPLEQNQHVQAEALYNEALDRFDQAQYRECLALLDQVLLLDRQDAYCYYARGNTRVSLGDYKGAAAEYLWALRRAPYFCDAMINLGNTYHRLKIYHKSLELYDRALYLEPQDGHAHYSRANTLAAIGRLPEAVEAFSTSIKLMPEHSGSYLNRGHVLSQLGRHQDALVDYNQAQMLEPGHSNIAWTVAWAHFDREGLTEDTVQELERISLLSPTHYTSALCLGVVALQRADLHRALTHFEHAAEQSGEWDPPFWVGMALACQGEDEPARLAIRQALTLGLPPILLMPLFWLKETNHDFFELYAREFLQGQAEP